MRLVRLLEAINSFTLDLALKSADGAAATAAVPAQPYIPTVGISELLSM